MSPTWLTVVLLLSSVLAVVTDAQSLAGYTVRFSQVVHRNGVSTPDVTGSDASAICGDVYGCGALVHEGVEQMVAIGQFARSRYNDASVVGADGAFFPSESYRPSAISSRAVALDSTLQSSSAFLAGVFPNLSTLYPAIISENATTNLVISTDSLPPVMLKRFVDYPGLEAQLQPTVDASFTLAQLQTMATEAHYTGCTQAARGQCALQLYHLRAYYAGVGQLTDKQNLSEASTGLTNVQRAYYQYVFSYNATDALSKKQGSMGQNLAQRLIANMRRFMSTPSSQKMHEYSTRDSVISPLAVTLGMADTDPSTLSPVYGESYVVELLQSTSGTNTWFVHVLRGAPSATSFTELSFTQRCMNPAGVTYVATDNICPFDDFVRYIGSTAPTIENGYCVVDQSQYTMLNCPATTRRRVASIHSYCDIFRSICPNFACPAGYLLNAADLKCYPISSAAAGEYNIRLAQVVHRHGARAPLVDFNITQICGYEYPCGTLNGVGQDMLKAVGAYVRARYNNLSNVAAPFFPTERYNASLVYTRSTGLQRTLQSATSFLHSIFPDTSYFFPVVFSVNMTTDFLLNTDPMPPVMLKRSKNDAGLKETLNPIVDQYFTWDELRGAAEDAYISGTCVDYEYRYQCALNVYDVGTSFRATNQLGDKPRLAAALPGVIAVNTQYYFYAFGYNASLELDRTQGTMAQNLAQEMLGNVYAHLLAPSYALYEYSTHDSMLAPLGVTLGDQSHETMEVQYGQTILLELLQDVGDGSYHIRVIRGSPQDTEGNGNFTFVRSSFVQHCINADGVEYVAKNDICPVADFARLVDSTRPTQPKGYCIVNQTMYDNLECPASVTEGKPVPRLCQLYRIACGSMACRAGYVLAQEDLQCYPESPAQTTTTTTTTTTTAPILSDDAPVPVPPAKRMSEARRREAAGSIARGVTSGVIIGTALAQNGQTA